MAYSYNPPPGPQNPSKYSSVGPNYQKYGEQPGYVYDPTKDQYVNQTTYDNNQLKDKAIHNQLNAAANPPKAPGIGQIAGTVGAVAGTGVIAQQLGKNFIPDPGTTGGAKGLLNIGKTAPTDPTVTTGGAQQVAAQTGAQQTGSSLAGQGSADGLNSAASGSQGAGIAPGSESAASGVQGGAQAAQAGEAPVSGLESGFANYGLPVVVAIDTAATTKYGYDKFIKNDPNADKGTQGKLGRGQLAITTVGLSELAKNISGGKGIDQTTRDKIRDGFQANGIADGKYNVTLADGTTYNIGLDGKAKILNADGKTQRHTYDVDLNNPLATANIGAVNNISAQILGLSDLSKLTDKQKKALSDSTGLLVNAVTSNAKDQKAVDANIAALQAKLKAGATQQAPSSSTTTSGATAAPAAAATPPAPAPISAPVQNAVNNTLRTQTSSPGIDKNGNRINYGNGLIGLGRR